MCCKKRMDYIRWSKLIIAEPMSHSIGLFCGTKSLVQQTILPLLLSYHSHDYCITILTKGYFGPCITTVQSNIVPNS